MRPLDGLGRLRFNGTLGRGGVKSLLDLELDPPWHPKMGVMPLLPTLTLHTGHGFFVFCSHWERQDQQNKWPHLVRTELVGCSMQMLHWNTSFTFTPWAPTTTFSSSELKQTVGLLSSMGANLTMNLK
jgi:hypothetical protein